MSGGSDLSMDLQAPLGTGLREANVGSGPRRERSGGAAGSAATDALGSGFSRHKRDGVVPGSSRLNNFDALRLLAALAVLISHSFAIAGRPQPTVGVMDVGTIGVMVFFGISGFLIAQSWTLDAHVGRFLTKRCLRIFPALVVLLLICALGLGPLVTALSLERYLGETGTWTYLIANALLLTTHQLPGVFAELPYPLQVNASLWTLQVEMIAYLGIIVVGLFGGLRTMWSAPLIAAVLIVAPHGLVPWDNALFVLQAFAVGSTLFVWREHVPWHWALAAAGIAAWAIAPEGLQLGLAVTVIPYATILIAYRGPTALRRLTARGDFSYGLYLWAWPVGQVVALLWGDSVTTVAVIAISLPITYALAVVSWLLIEKPALALKRRLARRSVEPRVRAPDAEPAIADDRRRAGDARFGSPPAEPLNQISPG